jgi:DNA-binding NtrC family response regulator
MSNEEKAAVRLLIVEDDEHMRQTLARRFGRQGMRVTACADAEEALAKAEHVPWDVALLDLQLPGMNGIELLAGLKEKQPQCEALLVTAHGTIETAIQALKRGAYDYLTKPFRLPDLEAHIQKAYEKAQVARREQQWVEHVRYESARYQLVGSSPVMQKVLGLIRKVAPTEATVLIRGASGTGKELVARALHTNSPRANRPLVTINCASLQEPLLESELFGHEKGAFTGAVQTKPGLIEVAEGGTLFIDEIGEMAPGLQAKLLRVLEDGHYRRVGSPHEQTADVRVIAATNRSLEEDLKGRRFREDLYYRLNVVTIHLPALRDRRSDIPELVEHFLTTRRIGSTPYRITDDALEALVRYDWPGNVRELANVLERAQILASDGRVTRADLPEKIAATAARAGADGACGDPLRLEEVERRHLLRVLEREKGNKVHAARALGVSRRALYRLIKKHKIEVRGEGNLRGGT